MTDEPGESLEGFGAIARALISSQPTAFASESDAEFAEAVVELAEAHAKDYLVRDGDELNLALTRVVMREIPGVDGALIGWLAENPSTERLGVVSRMLWQLWSTAVPHPPIAPSLVEALIAAADRVDVGATERGPLRAALRLAAAQLEDQHVLALIDRTSRSLRDERPGT